MTDNLYENFESIVDYNTVLDDFEGPLDLLLHLINIAKINIDDVFVSKVTEQFLNYIDFMKTQPSRDVDKESEYLAIAAQILYIKSKSLVPVINESEEEDAAAEEKRAFIEQLKQREYELLKEETPKLKTLETIGYYFKDPELDFSKVKVVYKDFNVNALLEAFAGLMLRNETMQREKTKVKEIPKDVHTVAEKVTFIRDKLSESSEFMFDSLFVTYSKNEIITTFQALLELLKYQFLKVEQTDNFGPILIKLNPDYRAEDITDEQFDEYN